MFLIKLCSERAEVRLTDTVLVLIILITNFILWKDFKLEIRDTKFYKFICCINEDYEKWDTVVNQDTIISSNDIITPSLRHTSISYNSLK